MIGQLTGDEGKVGYLVSQYPAISHTFIRREVAALRAAGISINTYSVRRGDAEDPNGTYVILEQSAASFLVAHLHSLFTRPVRYLSTIKLAASHRVPGVRAFFWSLLHFAEAIVLARQLRNDSIVRLHNHFANSAATVGLLASHFERMPWSVTLHGISEFDYPAGVLLAAKLEKARFAACASHFVMAQAMRSTRPAIWPRLSMVRCAVDPVDLPAKMTSAAVVDALRLICVGRLSPEKGHAGLIAVVAELLSQGRSFHLTLVGDGPELESLRALVQQHSIAEYVTFAGRLDEQATLAKIAEADALVLASFMEGLPVVLIEALALCVPVVASRVAGIPELVKHGETGLLFTPGDWNDLRSALESLIDNAELRERMALRGRERVLEEFVYPAAAAPLIPLLRDGGRD
jgi:glycosyltransferase involved in cell wall biosynthesis